MLGYIVAYEPVHNVRYCLLYISYLLTKLLDNDGQNENLLVHGTLIFETMTPIIMNVYICQHFYMITVF